MSKSKTKKAKVDAPKKQVRETFGESISCDFTKSGDHEYFAMTGKCFGCGRFDPKECTLQKPQGTKVIPGKRKERS